MGMITILVMAQILPARESTGAVLPMLLFADCFAVAVYRQHARWGDLWPALPPALVGIVLGYFLMQQIPDGSFRPVLGWIVFTMVGLQAANRWMPALLQRIPHTRGFAWVMGCISGVATMLANAAGPVMTVYLLARGLLKYEYVGTAAVFFLVINLVKVPFSFGLGLITWESLRLNLWLLPAILAGILLGKQVVHRIPQRLFELLLLLFAAAAALPLVLG